MGVKFTDYTMRCIRQKKNCSFKRLYFTKLYDVEEGVAYIKLTKVLEEFDVLPSEASGVVGALGNIDGLKAWVLFLEEDDVIRVRLRSKGPVINKLAMQYNGGGIRWLLVRGIFLGRSGSSFADLREICK